MAKAAARKHPNEQEIPEALKAKVPITANKGPRSSAGEKVTVGCKLPHGLILRVYKMVPYTVAVPGGAGREEKRAEQMGGDVKIDGFAVPLGAEHDKTLASGVALTHGIDKDFFELWLEQNSQADYVTSGLVFMAKSETDGRAHAADIKSVKSGFEPIDPKKPPRVGNLKVETADTKNT